MKLKAFAITLSALGTLSILTLTSTQSVFAANGYRYATHQKTDTVLLPEDGIMIPELVTTNAEIAFNVTESNSADTVITQENVSVDIVDAAGEPFDILPYANKIAWYDGSSHDHTDTLTSLLAIATNGVDSAIGHKKTFESYMFPTSWHAVGETGYSSTETVPATGTNNVTFSNTK